MSNIQIPNLPAVASLSGAELFEGVQSGSSVKISLGQILAAAANGTPTSLPVPIADGGTGATTAPGARTNLGLGTIAIQDANSVVLTGGSINGTTIGGITPADGSFTTGTFGLGAVGTPSITFTGDLNTGIWSPAADAVAISSGGVERLRVFGGIVSFPALTTETRTIEVGSGRSGDGASLIDLVGDATYTDYGTRLIRNLGANGATLLTTRGTGGIALQVQEAGAISLITSNTTRAVIPVAGGLNVVGDAAVTTTINVGISRSADGQSDIRLIADSANQQSLSMTAYSGTNGIRELRSRGTGALQFVTQDAAPLILTTASNERVRIISTGEVGIGTTLPLANLHVNAASAAASFRLSVADVTYANFFASASGVGLYNIQASPLSFGTTNIERFRVGADGQWGIGGANYGTSGQTVVSGGAGAAPAWGTLGLAGGGTGVTTAPAAAAVLYGYTTTATAAGTTVLTNTSSQYQLFTGVTTQIITLPVTSTLTTGWTFHIVNASTGNLTVNSSGANLVATVPANMTLMVTCIGTTLTTAADWEWGFTDFSSITGTGSNVLSDGPTITNGALNGTVGATTASTGAFTTVTATTSVKSSGAGGIGYATGAGVAVTQLTSRTTPAPTTGNKTSGSITLFSAAGVAGWTTFTVPNTAIAITDTITLTVRGNTNTYIAAASTIIAGTSFAISFNAVAGVAVDAPTINFNIIRGVNA